MLKSALQLGDSRMVSSIPLLIVYDLEARVK